MDYKRPPCLYPGRSSCIVIVLLPRVYQEEYVTAWASKLYTAKWWCHPVHVPAQPNHNNYNMQNPLFRLHSDHTCGCVVAGVLHTGIRKVWLDTKSGSNYPTMGLLCSIVDRLVWRHSFPKIMYLCSICLVSASCCDATITLHKHNTNIQELCTNKLLLLR